MWHSQISHFFSPYFPIRKFFLILYIREYDWWCFVLSIPAWRTKTTVVFESCGVRELQTENEANYFVHLAMPADLDWKLERPPPHKVRSLILCSVEAVDAEHHFSFAWTGAMEIFLESG